MPEPRAIQDTGLGKLIEVPEVGGLRGVPVLSQESPLHYYTPGLCAPRVSAAPDRISDRFRGLDIHAVPLLQYSILAKFTGQSVPQIQETTNP